MLNISGLMLIYHSMNFKSIILSTHFTLIKSNYNDNVIVVRLYIYNLIFIGNCQKVFEDFKKVRTQQFEIIDLFLILHLIKR